MIDDPVDGSLHPSFWINGGMPGSGSGATLIAKANGISIAFLINSSWKGGPGMFYTVQHNIMHSKKYAGNQAKNQNFNPSVLIFMGNQQKNFLCEMTDSKKN